MKHHLYNGIVLLLFVWIAYGCTRPKVALGDEKKFITEFRDLSRYTGDGSILISGHRGAWKHTGLPDNSLEGLQYATERVPNVFFEVDPRLTKDSVIVLMHDATLERTTNATGRLADYTWHELRDVRLKDDQGKITDYKIPTLKDAMRWSIGEIAWTRGALHGGGVAHPRSTGVGGRTGTCLQRGDRQETRYHLDRPAGGTL